MRVAQVVASYYPSIGGVQTHVHHLAQGCANAGDDVTILTHQAGHSPAEDYVGKVRVLRFPLTVDLRNYPFSMRLFRYLGSHAGEFDILHAHSYHTVVGHAGASSTLPFIFTPHYHGTGHTGFRTLLHGLYYPLGRRVLRRSDALICVSEAERRLISANFSIESSKMFVIPNGTDSDGLYHREDREAASVPMVLSVGRLERYKNVDLIIDAFQALALPARLVVVGDGPDRRRLEEAARGGGRSQQVFFAGRVSDSALRRLLGEATVVVSASDHEAFGLSVADGLAAGASIVASAIPAHIEIASMAGADAPIVLVDPRDKQAFAAALSATVCLDRTGSEPVRLPSWADVVDATRRLYGLVCSGRGSPRQRDWIAVPQHGASTPVTQASAEPV